MNFIREIVSGRKKRFTENGYNLDLTYVCNRIIAMSFPASGFESTYRNSIADVEIINYLICLQKILGCSVTKK